MRLPIVFNDRYQLNTKLGEGGLAEVFLAQDLALGRLVAVKLLRPEYTRDPSFLVRFHKEAQSAASLNNANVVAVFDFGQDHNRPYIVMEYVAGEDLRGVMDRGLLTVPQIVDYVIQVCNAVGGAHRRNMVHGDLKPGNILISPENRAKVTDFGLARALGESAMDDGELVWGTPAYFAPEQAAGDRVMPATDVYAIGIMLYEMLAGVSPFTGDNDQDVARKQLYEHHAPLSSHTQRVPAALEAIVDKTLAKNPSQRYHSADQLKQALLQFQRGSSDHTSFQAPAQAISHSRRTFDWLGLILGVVALLAVVGLIPLWIQVYRLYFQDGVSAGVPATVPTASPGQVYAPALVGFSEAEAQSIAEGIGLSMSVNGFETNSSVAAFSVVNQSLPEGYPIYPGETIYVTLSQGQNLISVPGVVGQSVKEAERQLQEAGLSVKAQNTWSTEPFGAVISQKPEGNALLTSRSNVILKVSGGTKVATASNFDNQILLAAYELPSITYNTNDLIPITLYWQALQTPKQNYEVLIQLTNTNGVVLAEYQAQPAHGTQPTVNWQVSRQVSDAYQLIIPHQLPSDVYQLRIGLVEPAQNRKLPIISVNQLETELETLILQEIKVN